MSVVVDRPAPQVARVLINRPDKRNAIDWDVRQGFLDELALLAETPDVRAIILGGVGGIFSAGGDLPSMKGLDETGARERMLHIHGLCQRIATMPVPVVTAMEGIAAGGAVGMALLGDHIVADADVRILFPFLNLGLTPDWGQLLTLPRRVGLPTARRFLTDGRAIGADEALAAGLVDEVVPAEAAMATAVTTAARLAQQPSRAFVDMRHRLTGGPALLAAELEREANDQARALTGTEFAEGFAAFGDRRAPDFPGCGHD